MPPTGRLPYAHCGLDDLVCGAYICKLPPTLIPIIQSRTGTKYLPVVSVSCKAYVLAPQQIGLVSLDVGVCGWALASLLIHNCVYVFEENLVDGRLVA